MKKIIVLVLLVLIYTGCMKSDDSFKPLDGYYSLYSVACECEPIDIETHQQQWLIDFENNEIDVKSLGDTPSYLILNTGVYSFELVKDVPIGPGDSSDVLKVNGCEYYFRLSENKESMHLSHFLSDLGSYVFIKNKSGEVK